MMTVVNPSTTRMDRRRRKARVFQNEIREAVVAYLVERDGWDCSFCGGPLNEPPRLVLGWNGREPKGGITLDHIVPLARGGLNRLENYRLLHLSCNVRAYKGPITLEAKRQRGLESYRQFKKRRSEERRAWVERNKTRARSS